MTTVEFYHKDELGHSEISGQRTFLAETRSMEGASRMNKFQRIEDNGRVWYWSHRQRQVESYMKFRFHST